jgi:hypothetical protein
VITCCCCVTDTTEVEEEEAMKSEAVGGRYTCGGDNVCGENGGNPDCTGDDDTEDEVDGVVGVET